MHPRGAAGVGGEEGGALVVEDPGHLVPAVVDLAAEHGADGDADVVVVDGGHGGDVGLAAHDVDGCDGDAGRGQRDEEDREAPVALGVGVGAGHADVDVVLVELGHAMAAPELLAVEHPLVAVAPRSHLDVRRVRPRVGLGDADGHQPFAGGEAGQVGGLLGLVAGAPHHVAGMMRPALDEGVGQLLDEDGVLHRVELGAALGLAPVGERASAWSGASPRFRGRSSRRRGGGRRGAGLRA